MRALSISGDSFSVVVDRFLRRSGSRVSILNPCRREVPSGHSSLRVIPIPSRTTRKSTRPRASDRSMGCQPGNHPACQLPKPNRRCRYSLKMQLRWNHVRPAAGPQGRKTEPNASHNEQGLEAKDALSPSGRGRKMSLTFPLQKLFHAGISATRRPSRAARLRSNWICCWRNLSS